MRADDAVDTDLGHDGKQRRHRGAGCGIGARQPEVQRHQRGLEAKHGQQHQRRGLRQPGVVTLELSHLQAHIGHVERAGHAVDHGQTNQEQARGRQVEHHVMDTHAKALAPLAMHQQHIRGDQQDLEEHEQVEQIARHERTAQPHELELEQRMEMPPPRVPAACGVPQHGHGHQVSQQHHQAGQTVQHHHDAKGRGPFAQLIDQQLTRAGLHHQADGHEQTEQNRGHGQATRPALAAVAMAATGHLLAAIAQQQQGHGREHGQQDRQHGRVLQPERKNSVEHQACPPRDVPAVWPAVCPAGWPGAWPGSCPSTWSLPLSWRLRRANSITKPVVAKPITMAVSTKA